MVARIQREERQGAMDASHSAYLFDNFSFWSPKLRTVGFSCGDGWFDLIKSLSEKIAYLRPSPDFVVTDVKEKMGFLRISTEHASPDIERLALGAENASERICEYCGSSGSTKRKSLMLKTICLYHETLYQRSKTWPSA